MDGSLGGMLLQGRRILPVTTEFAIHDLPRWILDLARQRVRVSTLTNSLHNTIYVLERSLSRNPGNMLWLLPDDFEICKSIAKATIPPLLPNNAEDSLINSIQQQCLVRFSDRGEPPRSC